MIASAWQKVRRVETDPALKQDMLNRGMSAWEIRVILDAGTGKSAGRFNCGR
jgi:hypothetical protein